ncbi:MAG: hypothetical protein KatS3mg004_0699 [Bryobacteraceae bacterium]|nr:MAG: hypothetical protein KatS3mg004_0699 [Bryobacteraceae bacterium]
MARVHPFRALRYTPAAGDIAGLATLPYDVIPPDLEEQYRARSPYNLVHLILPRGDYAGAARRLAEWRAAGILAPETEEAIYVYEQCFPAPGSGQWLTRRGFIALGDTEPYGETVFRHEFTLSGPREDRFRLLQATRVQFDSIFMLFADPQHGVQAMLDTAAAHPPELEYTDHQQTRHRLWRITDPAWISRLQAQMADRKLLIADGHHRYETALRMGQPRTMMTLVPFESPGLRCFATHRLVHSLPAFDPAALLASLPGVAPGIDPLVSPPGHVRIGIVTALGAHHADLPAPEGALNVVVLHDRILAPLLGITPEVAASGSHLAYTRSREEAVETVRSGRAQAAFLLEDLPVQNLARAAFAGLVLPQKSTYFYPKLGSGLVMYELPA